jgi:uracil-DNA glycosylase family 4
MSFIPLTPRGRLVPGFGKDTAKILIVNDYTTPFDDRELKPFSGPPGTVLEQCLQVAGILKAEVYCTNVFKTKTTLPYRLANSEFFDEEKRKFTELGLQHADMLRTEVNRHSANVIVAAGNAALQAITDFGSVAKYRGYVVSSTKLSRSRKVIPTHSPASTIRGTYVNRHMIVADLKKAKTEADSPELVRPHRDLMYDHTFEEALQWLDWLAEQPVLCFDIEVINFEMSCISFATTPELGIVIPLGPSEFKPNGWTEWEELQLWRGIQKVLGNPNSLKIVQNGSFDIHFLYTKYGIIIRGEIHDTMIGHSVMFPELPKGLGFLGSIYCGSQEYWKDSVKFKSIKAED